MHNHERLQAWQRAHALSVRICLAIGRTRTRGHRSLLTQFERAIVSIPANIAEGAGQSTDPQFARFLDVSIGSSHEAQSHLELIRAIGILPREDLAGWREELISTRRMLRGLCRRLRGTPGPA
jgi:four helix bundle protein